MSNWRITDLMKSLMTFGEATAAPALNQALRPLGVTELVTVSRTAPRNPNLPALWYERRTGTSVGVDTTTSRDDLYIAVMVGSRWTDEGVADEQTEAMLDVVREIYSKRCRESLPWGTHRARRWGVEIPVPTDINGIPVIVAGIVLQIQLQLPTGWPS